MMKNGNNPTRPSPPHVGEFVSLPEGREFAVADPDWQRLLLDYPVRFGCGVVLCCLRGTADISANLRTLHIERATQLVVMPNSVSMLLAISPDFDALCFVFSGQLFGKVTRRFDLPFFRALDEHPLSRLDAAAFESLRHWFDSMRRIYEDGGHRYRSAIAGNSLQNLFMEHYDRIRRGTVERRVASPDRPTELCRQFFRLVGEHCRTEHRVEWYADRLCVTSRYLSTVTREAARLSPKEVIDRMLTLEIRIMLETGERTVQQIADATGFRDQSYLSRYFRRHTGQSIREYRRMMG